MPDISKPAKVRIIAVEFEASVYCKPCFPAIPDNPVYRACTDRQIALICGILFVLTKERGGEGSPTIASVRQLYSSNRPYLLSHKPYVRDGEADSGQGYYAYDLRPDEQKALVEGERSWQPSDKLIQY